MWRDGEYGVWTSDGEWSPHPFSARYAAQARAALEGERRLWVRNGNGYGPERRIAVTILRVSRDGRWARVRDDGGGAHRVSWNCLVDEVVARRFYPESAARIWG